MENCTLAVHIAQKDWEGDDWRRILTHALGMDPTQVEDLVNSGERFGRGVVAGLVDVGETWRCEAELPEAEREELERAALLSDLREKHLTALSNPRWLLQPFYTRARKDLWTIDIPVELLPSSSSSSSLSGAQR